MQDVTEYVNEDKKCIFLNYDLFQIKFYVQLLVNWLPWCTQITMDNLFLISLS